LPEADAKLEAAPASEPPLRPVRAGTETILFAEDDDLVRYLAVAALASSGYRMIEAVQGEEALKATAEHSGPIHLLVTDIIMPKMGGVELAQRFLELRPGARVLYISGYAGDALSTGGPSLEVLQKPFTSDALLGRVREILDAPAVEAERA
jgi:DNA-binding NtrC family response regulator